MEAVGQSHAAKGGTGGQRKGQEPKEPSNVVPAGGKNF